MYEDSNGAIFRSKLLPKPIPSGYLLNILAPLLIALILVKSPPVEPEINRLKILLNEFAKKLLIFE